MTHFRNRVGDEALETLLQETLAAAHRAGALSVRATEAVAVDTTVQEKAIAHPTEPGLLLAAIEQLGAQAKKAELPLRQSASGQGRALHPAGAGAARQSLRRPHAESGFGRHPKYRGTHTATRRGRSRIQEASPGACAHRRLHRRAETRRDRQD